MEEVTLAGTILVANAPEKIKSYYRDLLGYWNDDEAEGHTSFNRFPFILRPPDAVAGISTPKTDWPCWLTHTCEELFVWPARVDEADIDEEQEAFRWAQRVATYLNAPIDYDRARDIYVEKSIRLLGDFDPKGIAPRIADLLKKRVRDGGQAFDLASEMLSAYREYQEAWEDYQDWRESAFNADDLKLPKDFPDRFSPEAVASVGISLAFLQASDVTYSLIVCPWNHREITAWHKGIRTLTLRDLRPLTDKEFNKLAAPYIRKARGFLLDALRQSLTPQGVEQKEWSCPSAECRDCFENLWNVMLSEMTISQRRIISRERANRNMEKISI